ncbi:uncharacterized protein TRIADDRAFT_11395, partial [Trichoplax adhaerens]
KIKSYTINFSKNQKAYFPGQTISGVVTIVLTESTRIKSIKIGIFGEAKTRIAYKSGDDTKTAYQNQKFLEHVTLNICLLKCLLDRNDKNLENHLLLAGQYRYPFAFRLPTSDILPSTFESIQPGNSIRYLVESWIELPLRVPPICKKPFTFLQVIDCNAPNFEPPLPLENEKSICCWCCQSGPLIIRAAIDKKAFVPGEKVTLLTAEIENYTDRNMNGIAISLLQMVTRRAKGILSTKSYASLAQSETIKQGCSFTWNDKSITIPCLPPTNSLSNILKVEYFIKVYVKVPMEPNLTIDLPVIVGTIPI